MKKYAIVFLFILGILSPNYASADVDFSLGGNAGIYLVNNTDYKELYGSNGMIFGGELGIRFNRIEVRGEFSLFQKTGQMSLTNESIKLSITPITVGIRIHLTQGRVSPYIGGGGGIFMVKEDVPDRLDDYSSTTFGFQAEGGLSLQFVNNLYFDLNFRYVLANAKEGNDSVPLGGIRAGAGLIFSF